MHNKMVPFYISLWVFFCQITFYLTEDLTSTLRIIYTQNNKTSSNRKKGLVLKLLWATHAYLWHLYCCSIGEKQWWKSRIKGAVATSAYSGRPESCFPVYFSPFSDASLFCWLLAIVLKLTPSSMGDSKPLGFQLLIINDSVGQSGQIKWSLEGHWSTHSIIHGILQHW